MVLVMFASVVLAVLPQKSLDEGDKTRAFLIVGVLICVASATYFIALNQEFLLWFVGLGFTPFLCVRLVPLLFRVFMRTARFVVGQVRTYCTDWMHQGIQPREGHKHVSRAESPAPGD